MLLAGAAWLSMSGVATLPVEGSLQGTPTQATESMTNFWEKFKGAVIKRDTATVASLSRFPVVRGVAWGDIKNRAQLRRRFRELFFSETNAAECFPKAKLHVEKDRPREFVVTCPFASNDGGGEVFVYTFTRTRAGWKFTSFENLNED